MGINDRMNLISAELHLFLSMVHSCWLAGAGTSQNVFGLI